MRSAVISMLILLLWAAAAMGAPKGAKPAAPALAHRMIVMSVTEKGFEPAKVKVRTRERVTLVVTRKTDRTCATELVMKAMGIKKALPLNKPVEIVFTPKKKGTLRYACGMDMISGQIVVE